MRIVSHVARWFRRPTRPDAPAAARTTAPVVEAMEGRTLMSAAPVRPAAAAPPDPGSTFATATRLPPPDVGVSVHGQVSTRDTADLYRFVARTSGEMTATLTDLSADLSLSVYNAAGRRVAVSDAGGTRPEQLQVSLTAGATYFVAVRYVTSPLSYNAGLSQQQGIAGSLYDLLMSGTDTAGNTPAAARSLGDLTGTGHSESAARVTTQTGYVGASDAADFYKFTINKVQKVKVKLAHLIGNADLELLDANGNALSPPAKSSNGGSADEFITRTLNPGTYLVKVSRVGANTNYDLTIKTWGV